MASRLCLAGWIPKHESELEGHDPIDGRRTHHTSPRVIQCIPHQTFDPLRRRGLTDLVPSHCRVRIVELLRQDVGSNELFDEPRYLPRSDAFIQSAIHVFVDRNGQLFCMGVTVSR